MTTTKECNSSLQKACFLRTEIEELENHIETGRQFQNEDMYEMLIATTELLLTQKQRELSAIISQIEEDK